MDKWILIRYLKGSDGVGGILITPKGIYTTVERPERDVRILPLDYKIEYYPQSGSGRFKNIWFVYAWPRKGILFHVGNYPRESRGCVLVGKKLYKKQDGSVYTTNSRQAMRELAELGGNEYMLTIKESQL